MFHKRVVWGKIKAFFFYFSNFIHLVKRVNFLLLFITSPEIVIVLYTVRKQSNNNQQQQERIRPLAYTWFIFGGNGGGSVVYSSAERMEWNLIIFSWKSLGVWGSVKQNWGDVGWIFIPGDAMGGNWNTGWTVLSFKALLFQELETIPQLKVEEVGISRYIFCNPRYWWWRWWYGVCSWFELLKLQVWIIERVLKRRLHAKKKNFFIKIPIFSNEKK